MTVRPIILAAGVGKRMRSSLPKVLHRICGRPMIRYVLAAVDEAGLGRPVVVVGRGAEAVQVEVGDGATFVFDGALLREGLRHVQPTNAQGEYYHTDVIAWTLSRGARVYALPVDDPAE